MNNNQDIFNNNPQMNNMNNSNPVITDQTGINNNSNEPLNVIPQSMPNYNQTDINHQFDGDFIKPAANTNSQNNIIQNQNTFINNPVNNFNNQLTPNDLEEDNPMLNAQKNKFITNNGESTNTSLNNLNVNGEYHDMPKVDYSQDPKVQENLKKRNTVTITSEGKVFIVIIIVLLLFIFVMPYIFDAIRNLIY